VKVLGVLDDEVAYVSRFRITPFVATILHPPRFKRNEFEVEKVIEVPLSKLEKKKFRMEMRSSGGKVFPIYYYRYGGYNIWGATGRILKGLLDLLSSVRRVEEKNVKPGRRPEAWWKGGGCSR
jgi:hypothetical protein